MKLKMMQKRETH